VPVSGGSFRHFGFVDAVAVVVHESNPLRGLTVAQLDAIFSRTRHRGHNGQVTTWDQLGVREWAGKPVRVVGTAPDAGDAIVTAAVAADPQAIGLTGMGHLAPGVRAIGIAPQARAPLLEPSYENVARAAYPLSRVFYLAVARKPGQPLPAPLDAFLRFLLSREGQSVVLSHGVFLPLRAAQAEEARRMLPPHTCASSAP
jgi:phosphate transport system substrate-binding protein